MSDNGQEKANHVRWDGRKRGWFENYFVKWNDPKSHTAAWVRYTLTSPTQSERKPYCELWAIVFQADDPANKFALKKRFLIHELAWGQDPFSLDIGQAFLDNHQCKGHLSDPQTNHSLSWDIRMHSSDEALFHLPIPVLYRLKFPKTKLACAHINARISGSMRVDGKHIEIEKAAGQQEHIWGTNQARGYTWGHCNSFVEDPNAVWEGLDAEICLGRWVCPHVKFFYLKSRSGEYLFNSPFQLLKNRSFTNLGIWEFRAKNREATLTGRLRCDSNRFIGLAYEDPSGEKLWCYNSKVANIELELFSARGKLLEKLTSRHSCALEHVSRSRHPLIDVAV